jgi:hypothetical protein
VPPAVLDAPWEIATAWIVQLAKVELAQTAARTL